MSILLVRVQHYIALVVLLASLFMLSACGEQNKFDFNRPNSALTGIDTLQADSTGGFARAFRSREFEFPQDYLAHPEFKQEWWYFTGNLSTATGDKYGYQLTIFRIGLKPDDRIIKTLDYISANPEPNSELSSNWRTNNIYMGHLALTDVTNQRFYDYEQF